MATRIAVTGDVFELRRQQFWDHFSFYGIIVSYDLIASQEVIIIQYFVSYHAQKAAEFPYHRIYGKCFAVELVDSRISRRYMLDQFLTEYQQTQSVNSDQFPNEVDSYDDHDLIVVDLEYSMRNEETIYFSDAEYFDLEFTAADVIAGQTAMEMEFMGEEGIEFLSDEVTGMDTDYDPQEREFVLQETVVSDFMDIDYDLQEREVVLQETVVSDFMNIDYDLQEREVVLQETVVSDFMNIDYEPQEREVVLQETVVSNLMVIDYEPREFVVQEDLMEID